MEPREIQVKAFTTNVAGADYTIYYIPGGKQWAAFDEGLAFGWNSSAGDFELETSENPLDPEVIEQELKAIDEAVEADDGEWAPIKEHNERWDIVLSWLKRYNSI